MTTPVIVGYTRKATSTGAATITEADLTGAGAQLGDMLLAGFRLNGTGSTTSTTPSNWTADGSVSTSQSGSYHFLFAYHSRFGTTATDPTIPASLPATFTTNTTGDGTAEVIVVILRPAYSVGTVTIGGSPRNSDPVPTWNTPLPSISVDGTIVALASVQAFNGGQMTDLSVPNGFTEYADLQQWPMTGPVYGLWGNAKIASYQTTTPVANKSLPSWTKITTQFGGAGSVSVAWTLDTVLPPLVVASSPWHIGSLRFGSTGPGW